MSLPSSCAALAPWNPRHRNGIQVSTVPVGASGCSKLGHSWKAEQQVGMQPRKGSGMMGALGTLLIFSQDNVEMELHGIPSTKMGSSTIPSFSSQELLWIPQLLPNWLTRGKQQKNRLGWSPRIMARTVIRRSLRSLSPQTIPEFHQQFPDPCGSNSGHPAQASHSSTWKRFHGESSWLTGIL